jgi:hypothetical protein
MVGGWLRGQRPNHVWCHLQFAHRVMCMLVSTKMLVLMTQALRSVSPLNACNPFSTPALASSVCDLLPFHIWLYWH